MWKCWWGKFQLKALGTSPFMVKECQHQTYRDNKPLASRSGVPVPVMSWTFGSTGVGGVETLFPGAAGGHSSFLCNMIPLHDLLLVCYLWKTTQCVIKQDRTALSWFCGHKPILTAQASSSLTLPMTSAPLTGHLASPNFCRCTPSCIVYSLSLKLCYSSLRIRSGFLPFLNHSQQ